jgi:CHAT domain-containing protein/tetratricopeptide (TPR) repeat protein
MLCKAVTVPLAIVINVTLCAFSAAESPSPSRTIEPGLVVESVVRGRQADKLGVRPGDIMRGWRRGDAKGVFDSPFSPAFVAIDQASRGLVTVHGSRGMQSRTWIFQSDSWGVQTRPNLSGTYLSIYQRAMQFAADGKPVEAAECLESAVAITNDDDPIWLASWFLASAARILIHAGKWQESDQKLEQAIHLSQNAGPIVRAELFRIWASSFEYRGELTRAASYYQDTLQESEKLDTDGMEVANSLLLLAAVDLEQDDSDQADAHLTRALAIARRLAPYSFQTATILEHFGILFEDRSDLENAERYYLGALRIEERYFPDSRQLASTLTNLGTLMHWRGDLGRAEAYHRRALSIAEKIEENGPQLAEILNNIGECVLEQGDAAKAEQYQKRALTIREQSAPGTVAVALTLGSLGEIARIRHDFVRAEGYYRQAIEAAAKANAPEQERAQLLTGEANVLRDQGEYHQTEELYRRALEIVAKSNPGSMDHAELLAELAGTLQHQEQTQGASELYREALTIIEKQALHLGGVVEDRSRYRATNIRYYQGYADVLLQQGRREQAFEVIERSRARTLLELLSTGHINIGKGVDSVLLSRERDLQRTLQAKTEVRVRLVASEHTQEQVSRIDSEIDNLLMQTKDIKAQLFLNTPEYAALVEPRQLSTAEIQQLLDGNTLLLEYSLGENGSHLWAATNDALMVYDLLPKKEIERAARELYDLWASRVIEQAGKAKGERDYEPAARRLSQMVLGPVTGLLGTKRLVIVADGALQYIPFAALPEPGKSFSSMPIIVRHEIVNLPSVSVIAEIRQRHNSHPKPPGMIAILADPVFDAKDERVSPTDLKTATNGTTPIRSNELGRAAADLGLTRNGTVHLNRLIYTRNEANAVMAVIPVGKGFQALDFEASRSTAMSGILAKYRVIHFATHGLLNNKHPELSGLVLSLVNKQGKTRDGFLKLQDIYDMKLRADLVVLSGCETGLGEEINGEGLVGLTRGFMYAGASRVVASLWSISDLATATLMAEFYKSMENGLRPAAALRAAQIQMWKQQQWKSPYYWAAFQIQGEWR